MILESTIMLGDDTDCDVEGCSGSYNSIYYSFNTANELHTVQVSVGCFGGETHVCELPGEAVNFLAPYREWPGGAEVSELISWLVR